MQTIIQRCSPYSMISRERMTANIQSMIHVHTNEIKGDIVEIGVWKGGSILSMILANQEINRDSSRTFHLYDTFSGMTEPTDVDKHANQYAKNLIRQNSDLLCTCSYETVKQNIERSTAYSNIRYHVGDICKTDYIPDTIALLRLDTDWYESTRFELEHFYPRVNSGGVVIIDDYGHWDGSRKAVDEFLVNHPNIKLIPIDYTGVMFYKQ